MLISLVLSPEAIMLISIYNWILLIFRSVFFFLILPCFKKLHMCFLLWIQVLLSLGWIFLTVHKNQSSVFMLGSSLGILLSIPLLIHSASANDNFFHIAFLHHDKRLLHFLIQRPCIILPFLCPCLFFCFLTIVTMWLLQEYCHPHSYDDIASSFSFKYVLICFHS